MLEKWKLHEADNYMLALKDIYLDDTVSNRMGNGDKQLLMIILTISIVVLLLALINYINLQIASNHSRLAELKLRKIMGAGKRELVKQGVLESLLIICVSGIAAMLLLDMFYLSSVSQILGTEILTIREWSFQSWSILVASGLLLGIVAGVVPSLKLFRVKAITQQEIKQKKLGKLTVSLLSFNSLSLPPC